MANEINESTGDKGDPGRKCAMRIYENLLSTNMGEKKSPQDIRAGKGFSWDNRRIDIIPDEDRSGICAYFYRNGLMTAQVGLSAKAAFILSTELRNMLASDERFLDAIKKQDVKEPKE